MARRTIKRKGAQTLLRVVVVALAVIFGAAAGLASPAVKKGGILRISRPRDIDSVDPALAYTPDSWAIEYATCAKLYNYPDKPAPQGAIAVPEVAVAFPKVSAGGAVQTITLKRSYRFDTGARITAANFVAAFNRDANPRLQSAATAYLHDIVGGDAVIDGRAQTISGVRAVAPYTIRIHTTRPMPDIVARLTTPFFCPIAVDTPLHEIDDPLGSGPYYVASRVPEREVVLRRNPYYRGSRPANVDGIVWTIGGREACRVAVEQNQLDYCAGGGIPTQDLRQVATKYGINREGGQFFANTTMETDYFAFNHDRRAFMGVGQIPLAQAINWAIDRPALVRADGYLSGRETDQILPPAMAANAEIYPLGGVNERSLTRARALLAKAKFKPKRLVLYSPNFDPNPALARIFQFNLKRLGIDVQIEYFDAGTLKDKIATRGAPYDVALTGWIADFPDASSFFSTLQGNDLRSAGNINTAYFNRPRYNRAIARIAHLAGKKRRRAFAALDLTMMRIDPPWAPYTNPLRDDFVSKSVGCYVFNPVYWFDIAAVCMR
jgi:peptide/nickel transport system substrate-binding protein